MSLREIPEGPLNALAAVAASWRTRGRAPTSAELARLGITSVDTAVTAAITRGLLTQDWARGKRVPGTLRPTLRGWRIVEGDASEAA